MFVATSKINKPLLPELAVPLCYRRPGAAWSYNLLVLFMVLGLLMGRGAAMPVEKKPRWVNPCSLSGHQFDPIIDMDGAPPLQLNVLFSGVEEAAKVANLHSKEIRDNFVKEYFPDPDFVRGTSEYRQNWLPKIPPIRDEDFRTMSPQKAFLLSFEFLRCFAVGIEQIIVDQLFNDGLFLTAFRDVENHLTQVLCELQLGLFSLRVPPSSDVLRDVMSQEYRNLQGRSLKNIRDYLILRDYVEATEFVARFFKYLRRTL